MNKKFSNIIVFNNMGIDYIKEKIISIFSGLNYSLTNDEGYIQVDILNDNENNICIITSNFFKFNNLDVNKSVIRKIAKRTMQDTFMATADDEFTVLEKYSFNKRTYDYIAFGNEEKLKNYNYTNTDGYIYPQIWKNHFVGRNNIENLNKIIKEKNTFFHYYEIIIEILKLYGIKKELVSYNLGDKISNIDVEKITLFFK